MIEGTRQLAYAHRRIIILVVTLSFLLTLTVYDYLLEFKHMKSSIRTSFHKIKHYFGIEFDWLNSQFSDQDLSIDLHLEDSVLGHTGRTVGHRNVNRTNNVTVIAIGMGLTSKGVKDTSEINITSTFQFFHTFLRSFCMTTSLGYEYAFYIAYDHSDEALSRLSFLQTFQKKFHTYIKDRCTLGIKASIHMVQCRHSGKPAWAQNDAMLEAYLDNVDYYYRVNDDTYLESKKWVEHFISVLAKYDPPNLGVVGPKHKGGNTAILTYDFVHRTHIDVLGYYYPRLFTDWFGDRWITMVYQPDRSTKAHAITLHHTMALGQRYQTHHVGKKLSAQLLIDKKTIHRYINSTRRNESDLADGTKIIAMSLYGDDPKYTWGAIRNAQLTPIYFPSWRLRVYIPDPASSSTAGRDPLLVVPDRIVTKLRQLGADVVRVRIPASEIPPRYWRYLVMDDVSVNYFIVRDADSRLSERDAVVTEDWLQSYTDGGDSGRNGEANGKREGEMKKKSNFEISVHCIRDHPKHRDKPIIDGLWGANVRLIKKALQQQSMKKLLKQYFTINKTDVPFFHSFKSRTNTTLISNPMASRDFLRDVLWPLVASTSIYHDSVSCQESRTPSPRFYIKISREDSEYLGQEFDAHNEITSSDRRLVDNLDYRGCKKSNTKM